ncbi:SDR family oxidoreductase [Mucilaginibacter pallidiroseus]|uniref:SDR family oxidoreductase n=1 Tax=Mucilaginibacter pallidiroseus TaxID=2599295 RepID=A0A563UJ24_9SPHI|nr:SDR family oxidoreductase [Mucilaginibacter pallidiroseus]TWR31372.1 SDR family oxidoreductase [Mucilaginibacter pallidiroseus]
MKLKDKVVIITGASSGIGKSLAYQLAHHGANLVLGARQFVTLCEITQDIEKQFDVRAVAVACDVTKEDDCAALIKQATLTFGHIDILVNNAGISMRALFKDADVQVLKNLMDVNFWGTVYCTKYALPEILKSKGSIVSVSSIAGYKGLPGRSGYSASKYAMNGFMDALRVENLKTGVHIMVACPGFTATNIRNTALNNKGMQQGESTLEESKMMSADEVAGKIIDGIINRKRTIVMTTQGKLTALLSKFAPAFLDKMVYNVFAKEKNSLLK